MRKQSLRTFYIILLTQTISLIGSRMTGLAVGIRVFKDTESVTPLAMVAFFSALPTVLSAGVAGVLADRWDRRKVMAVADAGQAAATLFLLTVFVTGVFEVWHLYVVAVVEAAFGIFQAPAFQASITMLIPDDQRDRANAIQQLTGPASGIVAPVLAGLLFAVVGAAGVMVIDLVTFLFAIVVILLVHIPRPVVTEEGQATAGLSVWKQAFVGFNYLRTKGMLLWLVFAATMANFLIGGALIYNTPYILTITGSEATLGLLLGVMSAGPLVGGIIMSVWGGTNPRIHTILPGIALEGVFLIIYGMTRSPLAMGMALFFVLFPVPIINASFMSLLQIKIPPDLQGRVFSAVLQLAMLLNPLTYLIAGPLADKVFEPAVGTASWWPVVAPLVGTRAGSGIGLVMMIYGVLMIVVQLGMYAIPAMRRLEADLPDYVVHKDAVDEAARDAAPLPDAETEAMPAH